MSGRVITTEGSPLSRTQVTINGVATMSLFDGSFQVDNVSRPYTVVLQHVGLKSSDVVVYEGLTRSDPTFALKAADDGASNNVSVFGTATGGAGIPVPPNHTTHLEFGSTRRIDGSPQTLATGTGSFSFAIDWTGVQPLEGVLFALQYEHDGANVPTSYKAFGSRVVQFFGGDAMNQDIAMDPIVTDSISGVVSGGGLGLGVEFVDTELVLRFMPGRRRVLASLSSTFGNISVPAPVIPGALFDLGVARTPLGGGRVGITAQNVSAGESGLALALPTSGVPLLSPPDSATNVVPETMFSGESISQRIYQFQFTTPGGLHACVFSPDPSITLEGLSMAGLELSSDASYEWTMSTFGPLDSLDEAVGPTGTTDLPELHWSKSVSRTFVTAP